MSITIEELWNEVGFQPTPAQREAITAETGLLFLTAGPGSGKTRVLLWRVVNLIVFRNADPNGIFLSTFTEKAAFQLQQGLRALLGIAANHTGHQHDVSRMYVGTVHSLCQRILLDRRFAPDRRRGQTPVILDATDQYFFVYRRRNWLALLDAADTTNEGINQFFSGQTSKSRHRAVTSLIQLFNRLSEESIDPAEALKRTRDRTFQKMLRAYVTYRTLLAPADGAKRVDLSLLQQAAFDRIRAFAGADSVFEHIIVDEYQDTNPIQEKVFFALARKYKNLCVVGDDDQALYRFRGATVENFVNFPDRCRDEFRKSPKAIPLSANFRSRRGIVDSYTAFIDTCNWKRRGGKAYRITDKKITAHSRDVRQSVFTTAADKPESVCKEIARFVRCVVDDRKVHDPNQIAFLFPSLKSMMVSKMRAALEAENLQVYAPRAGRFLDAPEALALFGVFIKVFGKPVFGHFPGQDYAEFVDWTGKCDTTAQRLIRNDENLRQFILNRRGQLQQVANDYNKLVAKCVANGWDLESNVTLAMRAVLAATPALSVQAAGTLRSPYMERVIRKRGEEGRPFSLHYVITTATSVDWSVLDLFYQVMAFDHFKSMFDAAESGEDEGPVCNLALISQYLARFTEQYSPMITGRFLSGDLFTRFLFSSYLYALYRLGESETEDADDPFPRGRIPFLTIHQAKGLEFPIVVLGSPRKNDRGPQRIEEIVRPLITRPSEPLDRCNEFDIMRMFYVSLSRPQNVLVFAHPKGQGISTHNGISSVIESHATPLKDADISAIPEAKITTDELPKNYSYTSDYLLYQKCGRQYMVFRKYGFVPSRAQTQFFGSLVHKTIEDLHHLLIAQRVKEATA
jgi:DNA helicase II / ATP-dependent DNA helicase PcrA